jgi:hypothetical protein
MLHLSTTHTDGGDMSLKQYIKERNKAISEMDMVWLREHRPPGWPAEVQDEVIIAAAHKCRYETTGIAPKLRHESREWLKQHGYNRMFNQAFLPDEELPE